MRKLSVLCMLICFTATFTHNSMFMLSIEKGGVHTEFFSLEHIMKSASSAQANTSPDSRSNFQSSHNYYHNHIKLNLYTIPESKLLPAGAKAFYSIVDIPLLSQVFSESLTVKPSPRKHDYDDLLKLPISLLQQSAVLLI